MHVHVHASGVCMCMCMCMWHMGRARTILAIRICALLQRLAGHLSREACIFPTVLCRHVDSRLLSRSRDKRSKREAPQCSSALHARTRPIMAAIVVGAVVRVVVQE